MPGFVKVLVVRFSSIGDIVLTTPVVRILKQQFDGEVELHYLTRKPFASLLEANPYIDKVHALEGKLPDLMPALREEEFHYVIDLHRNLRSRVVKNGLQAMSFTFPKLNKEKWILVNFKIDRMPDIHIVDRYLKALDAFSVENDGLGLDYFIPPEDEVDLNTLPESHRNGYVAYAIGGQHATKAMPADKIASLVERISYPVMLLGGEGDREAAAFITEKVSTPVYDACGKYNLNQSASLIRQADRVITHDTGLMHIAAAFRKHIVSIWGNTVPQLGMYPYLPEGEGKSIIIEQKDLSCRPCSKLGFDKCPKKHFRCMRDHDEQAIVDALELPEK